MISFVFSNPRHHLDMMVPVARELRARGTACQFVSLTGLRGFPTPDLAARLPGVALHSALPRIRRSPSAGAGLGTNGGRGARARQLATRMLWRLALQPSLRWWLRGSAVVAVPNDAAFPYGELAASLRTHTTPFALLQEGIRFPLPTETTAGHAYGSSGASAICVWGEASAAHFRAVGAPARSIHVTGNPRFDEVEPRAWAADGRALAARLGLTRAPLVYLSNTIDDQGFCTTAEKLALFTRFLRKARPVAAAADRAIVVKLHARESVDAFRAAARDLPGVHVLGAEPLFAVLAMGHAAVVLASTVGLEALAFGLPLGVLEIPGHGHVFDYVSSGAARPLRLSTLAADVGQLLAAGAADTRAAGAYLEHHMAHRGEAAARIATCLDELRTS